MSRGSLFCLICVAAVVAGCGRGPRPRSNRWAASCSVCNWKTLGRVDSDMPLKDGDPCRNGSCRGTVRIEFFGAETQERMVDTGSQRVDPGPSGLGGFIKP
jgi:hypothetical protein